MIRLVLSEDNFEYDIRGIVMSFYPGEEITTKDIPSDKIINADYFEHYADISFTVFDRIPCIEESCPDKKASDGCEAERAVSDKKNDECEAGQIVFRKTLRAQAEYDDRKEYKCALKRGLYSLLSEHTGRTLPWGTLTGIRPTKIPMAMYEEGASDEEIISYMKDEYLTSDEKIRLSMEIAARELKILENIDYEDGYSIYVGIPFCPTTCLYCSFTSNPIGMWRNRVDEYLDAVFKEIDYVAEAFKDKKLNTIYIGGGTPTSITAGQMDRLLTKLEDSFDFTYMQEFTVEAGRPDSITIDKLEAIKKHKVTRISINPQTMKQDTLKLIGRHHTVEQIKEVFALARQTGFDNINMDIILGLPEENIDDVRNTMEELVRLAPENITVHSLAVKRAARLNTEKELYSGLSMVNTDEMMQLTADYCAKIGLKPYYLYRQKNMAGNLENVGYAKEGKAGIYNILIMEEKQSIIALGAGSVTKRAFPDGRLERCVNVKEVNQYIERIDEMIERKRQLFS
ncbi:MAG: coproporphyrinogen dehydrogenase HemZ [Lachnospiraceae bacterium]|nr:coproporphyrinogen dehydrogenase HemZ [Lachnospiraceae bacterium]